ncbi:MAG: SDR family oxidoreductase [Bacteroidota bacterium]
MQKNALIIGGSSGIGLATVKKLAASKFNIYLIHRDRKKDVLQLEETLTQLSNEHAISTRSFNIDATNEEKINEFFDSFEDFKGQFDLILHAVSRGNLKPMTGEGPSLSSQDLALTLDAMGINLHTWISKLLDKQLIREGSRIIALTSEGNKKFWEGYGAVATAKAALETIANYLAIELAPMGIRVNIIQAGVTDTPSLRLIPGSEELIQQTANRNPFGRLTTPEDVANAIYLLTLPEASWINGTLIHVDGGEHLI